MSGADDLPVRFDERGLVPAIAQDAASGEVLMLAWMNREALERTRETGEAHYFSRSRSALWRKGERSGQVQRVVAIRLDCDGDTLLLMVEQTGVACHTGHRSCFYREIATDGVVEREAALIDPATLYAP